MESFIEFPVFDGVFGDLRQWILWLEVFFVRERFTADEKMNLAQSLLEGEANAWFYNIRKRFAFQSWEHLVDHLIWKFGDFSDPELLLLFDKNDRLLQKQIDDAKLRRMSRKAITPHESISSPATIHEPVPVNKFSNQQVDEISGEKKDESHESTLVEVSDSLEEESIHQNQVPVASVEPSLSFSCESLVVSDARQSEIVSNNWVHSQSVLECVKNKATAYQVFDKTSLHKERLKPKNKRKLSLSLKTWMFKFKNKLLHRNKSTNQILAELNFDSVNVSTSRSNKSSDPSSFVIRVRDYSKYGTVIKTDLGKEEKVHELPHQEKILKDGDDDDEKILSQYRPSMLVEEALLEVVTKPVAECKTTNNISFTHHKSQERFEILIKQIIRRDDEVSTNIIDNAASSSGSHAKSLLIEMGFCPTLVQKAIDENGEDLELLLEILTKITVTEEPSFHGWEPKPEPDIASETDSRRMTLLTMKFPENLVDLALDKFGKDTSIDEMVAFIVAAQLAEISAKEVICAWAECMMNTTIVISVKLYSLFSCEVDTNENMSSGLSQTRQVWEPGGVLAAHFLVDWLVDFHDSAGIVDGIRCLAIGVCSGIQQPIDSRRASRVWERGGVDIILGMHWLDTLGTCVVVGMQLIVVCMLHSWRVCILFTNSWERKFCKDWWFKFKSNIRIGEAFDYGTIYFWIHNCSRCSCICCSGFYLFTLEVKRHFNGGSIDTFGQAGGDVAVVSSQRKDTNWERSFAVSSREAP